MALMSNRLIDGRKRSAVFRMPFTASCDEVSCARLNLGSHPFYRLLFRRRATASVRVRAGVFGARILVAFYSW